MEKLNSYQTYYPPVSISRLHLEMASQKKIAHVEPEESFDLVLKNATEKVGRNNPPPPPQVAQFNEFAFMKAGRTLEVVAGLEPASNLSVTDDMAGRIDRNGGQETTSATRQEPRADMEQPVSVSAPDLTEQPTRARAPQKDNPSDNFALSPEFQEDEL